MNELHLTKKDFKLEWFNGTGAGGQHRNKCANSCRITHIESGIMCTGQNSRSRVENQKDAFTRLAQLVIDWHNAQEVSDRAISDEVIRNYHAERNEVHDKASGLKQPYKDVVDDGNIADMVDARRQTFGE
jgi:protein subunit release factor A